MAVLLPLLVVAAALWWLWRSAFPARPAKVPSRSRRCGGCVITLVHVLHGSERCYMGPVLQFLFACGPLLLSF